MKFIFKFILVVLFVILNSERNLFAGETTPRDSRNSIAFKVGYHVYQDSSFTDFYEAGSPDIDAVFNTSDLNSFSLEFAYDRKFTSYIGVEFSLGYAPSSTKTYTSTSGDSFRIAINNLYFSPSFKTYLPLGDIFSFYAGVGPDLDLMIGDLKYTSASGQRSSPTDSKLGFGFHGLIGFDWWIFRFPTEDSYQAAVSLFLEYKYSWIIVPDADEQIINFIDPLFEGDFTAHDLNVGGHTVFSGLRWHF